MKLQKIYLVSSGIYGTTVDMIGVEGALYKDDNLVATLPYVRRDFEPGVETDIWSELATTDADKAVIKVLNVEAPATLYFLSSDGKVISQEIAQQVVSSSEYLEGEEYTIQLQPKISMPLIILAALLGLLLWTSKKAKKK